MNVRCWVGALALGLLAALDAGAMTVDQAYAQLKHRRTVFDASRTGASKVQVESLQRIFAYAELGTILKVRAYNAHYHGDKAAYAAVLRDYDALIAITKGQAPPADVKQVHDLVAGAIAEQRAVLASSAAKPKEALSRASLARAPEVQKVHRDLIQAYNVLIAKFPKEPQVNRDAFYDYLCALDFL